MRGKAIPDDQQRAGQMPEQVHQELHHLFFGDGFVEDLEIEIPPGDAGGYGDGLPVKVILQHGCLPAWSPGTATVRPLAQSAFVDEDDGAAFRLGFFLMAGQRSLFHCWMAASSRSSARPAGRCTLQFNWRRIFQTCPA